MDENTKHVVASNLTAAFYAGYVREAEHKSADDLTYSIMLTYAGFLARLDGSESPSDIAPESSESGT